MDNKPKGWGKREITSWKTIDNNTRTQWLEEKEESAFSSVVQEPNSEPEKKEEAVQATHDDRKAEGDKKNFVPIIALIVSALALCVCAVVLIKAFGGSHKGPEENSDNVIANVEEEQSEDASEAHAVDDSSEADLETQDASEEPVDSRPYTVDPYLLFLEGQTAFYSDPWSQEPLIEGYIGEDGTFTIVEEYIDSYGNYWGHLKSGVGWVKLSEGFIPQTFNTPDGSFAFNDVTHRIDFVTATSTLPPQGEVNYDSTNIVDGDWRTAWSADSKSEIPYVESGMPIDMMAYYGEDERVMLVLDSKVNISGISILNGYIKTEELYYMNARPNEVSVIIYNEEGIAGVERIVLEDWFASAGDGYQTFYFDESIEGSEVELQINSIYAGSKYQDITITEVILWGD